VDVLTLRDAATGAPLGRLTTEQLQLLRDHLEEAGPQDHDYYIDAGTIELLEDAGADDHLVKTLRSALGDREGIDVRWDDF
jgi:processive 1,2-diacylglycerol beta-glucosyltransferase